MEKQTLYNVVWVDDNIDTLTADIHNKRLLSKKDINIIPAHTSVEFRDIMNMCYDRIDAVITDANFGKYSTDVDERDLSGFEDIKSCIEFFNTKREIPFYLCTGRPNLLEGNYMEYFRKNNRYFQRGDFPALLDKLVSEVQHINSPSYRIRKKYAKELKAASLIDGNEETLFHALMYEYSDDWKNTEDYFNPQRKIVERIFVKCKDLGIIPKGVSQLNNFSSFLRNEYQYFKVKEDCEIMPKPLVHSLEYFLNITQDGSHGDGDLKLGVDRFVRQKQNINLFRTVLYITMDLCLWYAEVENNDFRSNIQKWEIVKENFVHNGQIQLVEGKKVCGSYQIHFDCDLPVGSFILVKKTKNHDNNKIPFEYTNESGEVISVIHYVYTTDIVELF